MHEFLITTGRHKEPDFLARNPMGKVPVVVDEGIPVAELGAIAIYLADRHRTTPLSPALDHPDRAAFLRWCFFASAIMEPALGERFFKWNAPASAVAWGSYAQAEETLSKAVSDSPFLLGATFSAADVLVGSIARFGIQFGAMPKEGPIAAYVERLSTRPAFVRTQAIEAESLARLTPPTP
jgi:glutathione S-transferase